MNVPDELMRRIRGFIGLFSRQCATCMRRSVYNCANCNEVNTARSIMLDIGNIVEVREERYFVDNKLDERHARIMRAILQAGRPVQSSEILLSGVSKALKCFTLKSMCKHGFLRSMPARGGRYSFDITERGRRRLAELNKNILSRA